MKKAVVFALSLVLMLSVFSGCASGDNRLIKDCISGYAQAVRECDFEKAATYLANGEASPFDSGKGGISVQALNKLLKEKNVSAEEIKQVLGPITEKIEITVSDDKISIDGDKAKVTVNYKVPDFTEILEMDDATAEEYFKEFFEQRGQTMQEFISNADNLSEEETDKFSVEYTKFVLTKSAPNMAVKDESVDLQLEKIDGKWLIAD